MYLERLAFLDEISAVLSHEINNPLAIIDLCTNSLLNKIEKENFDEENIKNKLVKIRKSSKRISKFVFDLKTFSREGSKDEFTTIDLEKFIEEILSNFKYEHMGSDIEFRIKKIPEIKFECRPSQMAQVIINLITNAYEANQTSKEKWIEISIEESTASNYLTFYIRDSGKGVPDKILAPFFTTKEIGKGTELRLGLSISKKIIEEHSGEFYLDKNNNSTLFVFKIPLKRSLLLNAS
jgi:C4-dicarboxylate-specific signal transduction histidine kinase